MIEENHHNKQYSASDIQRYLKGEMSAEEMHQIETAALEDPFLADAIEGYEAVLAQGKEETIISGINKLNNDIIQRVSRPSRVIPMPYSKWWQVAAVASIIIITGVAFYNNWIKPEPNANSLAVIEKTSSDSPTLKQQAEEKTLSKGSVDSPTINSMPKNQSSTPTGIVSAPVKNKSQIETDSKAGEERSEAIATSPEGKKPDVAIEDVATTENAKKTDNYPPVTAKKDVGQKDQASPGNAEPIARRSERLAQQLNNFSGRVMDTNNKPLAKANLQVLSNKTTVVTDEYGSFQFTAKDSVADVQVSHIGFEQRNFRLQNNLASNNIVLEPQKESMDEVVVTGYGARQKRAVANSGAKVQDAVPAIGWTEYEKYLEKNKTPPANNPLMKGEVVVSFEVKKPTILSDFKIEKSLAKDYDAEAIRLIKEGPSWKLLKGYQTRMTVTVKF